MEAKRAFFNAVAHDLGFHPMEDFTSWNDLSLEDIKDYPVHIPHPHVRTHRSRTSKRNRHSHFTIKIIQLIGAHSESFVGPPS